MERSLEAAGRFTHWALRRWRQTSNTFKRCGQTGVLKSFEFLEIAVHTDYIAMRLSNHVTDRHFYIQQLHCANCG